MLEPLGGKTNTLSTVDKDNWIMEYEIIPILRIKEATKAGFVEIHPGECFDAENPNSETRRGRKNDRQIQLPHGTERHRTS